MKTINGRTANYAIENIFLRRSSPRAFSKESISQEELMMLFEAARWAPSANNLQPWKFIYAVRGTPEFDTFYSLLQDFNKSWCIGAGALIVTISKNTRTATDGSIKENRTHSFDTGAAWENLALQASQMGIIAHGMAGFDYDKVKQQLGIPDDYTVEMMIAVGKPGNVEDLPEALQKGEKPNDRKPLEEIVSEGKFSA